MSPDEARRTREGLRWLIRTAQSMDDVDALQRRGLITEALADRYARLWAQGTATEHPATRGWLIARWLARRVRIQSAVRSVMKQPV